MILSFHNVAFQTKYLETEINKIYGEDKTINEAMDRMFPDEHLDRGIIIHLLPEVYQ